ncbi:MAG TPA: hypothetical protein GXX50_04355 [Firmicutes bacterium]|nr:hypothetical protein [Bacillota bacterium]
MAVYRTAIRALVAVLIVLLALTGCRLQRPSGGRDLPAPAAVGPGLAPGEGNSAAPVPPEGPAADEPAPAEPTPPAEPKPPGAAAPLLPAGVELSHTQGRIAIGPFYGILPELAWSPAGDRLAIYGETGGYGIWVWNKDKGDVVRLLKLLDRSGQGATAVAFFGWSRDGGALYYAVDGVQAAGPHLGERGVAVKKVRLDGVEEEIAWLPGGPELIRSQHFNPATGWLLVHRGQDLWRVNVESGQKVHLKDNLPTWDGLFGVTPSPTGEVVAYPDTRPQRHGLLLLDVNTGKEVEVGAAGEYAFAPVWSPDGSKLSFLSAQARGETYDFQIGEDGPLPPATRLNVVTKEGHPLASWVAPQGEKAGAPVWSADGRQVAFLSAVVTKGADGMDAVRWQRLLLAAPGEALRDLGAVHGEWLAVAGFVPGGRQVLVYRYEAGGGVTVLAYGPDAGRVQVLMQEAVDEPPAWWRANLLAARLESGPNDTLNTQIYLRSPAGKTAQLTTGAGWKSRLTLSDSWLAYLSADNQAAPYPITVWLRSLP